MKEGCTCAIPKTDSPTPSIPNYDCSSPIDDGSPGLKLELEVQLDETGGSFDWDLTNENVETSGWKGGQNGDYTPGELLTYEMCLPKEECWNLALRGGGSDGNDVSYYKVYVAGEEIFSGEDWENQHEICIGKTQHCSDRSDKFRYRLVEKKSAKKKTEKKKIEKKIDCETLGDRRETSTRARRKICKAKFRRKGMAKVNRACLETCGKMGLGDCEFLQTYGDDGTETLVPSNLIELD